MRTALHIQNSGGLASVLRVLLAALVVACATLAPRAAHAAGTVQVANLSPQENDGKWKLQMTLNYGGVPHIGHIPMLFIFTPTMLYERSLTDQSPERPIITRMPLQNQQSINESMDVGFADASGKVFAITKFDFVIRRDRGFEAGEYKLEIKRAGDGVRVGNVMTLKLQGDNPIVDRRAIVFAGEKKKKKPAEEGDGAKKEGEPAEKKEGEPAEAPSEGATGDSAEATGEPTEGVEQPPPVEPKQGGCGCRVGADPNEGAAAFAALAVGAAVLARRYRRRPDNRI
jgi:MYXO-CTERM domain-containing protein